MILCINTSPKSIRMISEFIKLKSRSQQEKAFFPYIPHGFPLVGRHSVGSFVSEEVLREVSLWCMAPCGVFFVESRTEKWPARSGPARPSPQWTTAHCRTLCFWSLLPSFLQELSTLGLKNKGKKKILSVSDPVAHDAVIGEWKSLMCLFLTTRELECWFAVPQG